MSRTKYNKAMKEVDRYLDNLEHSAILNERPDKLYERLFHDIASIVLRHFEDVDITKGTELSVSTDTTGDGLRIIITGYVKVDDNHFLQIEKEYRR